MFEVTHISASQALFEYALLTGYGGEVLKIQMRYEQVWSSGSML